MIEQDPRGGTEAEDGSTVTITVSLGPGTVGVPKLAGKPERGGSEAARRRRLRGRRSTASRLAAWTSGQVIGTSPAEDTAARAGLDGGADRLDRRGDRGRAERRSVSTGSTRDGRSSRTPASSSTPRPARFGRARGPGDQPGPRRRRGREVGSEVTIVYSTGVGTITLDNYVGQTLTSAEAELEALELNVARSSRTPSTTSPQDGIVLDQAPTAGTELSPGDRVTLTVGESSPSRRPRRRRPTTDPTDDRRREGRGAARRPLERASGLAALGRRRRRGAARGRARGRRRGDRARRALARRGRGGRAPRRRGPARLRRRLPGAARAVRRGRDRAGPAREPRRPLRRARGAGRGGDDRQADLQAAAARARDRAGRLLRGRGGRLARAGRGDGLARLGQALAARLERRHRQGRASRAGSTPRSRRPAASTPG